MKSVMVEFNRFGVPGGTLQKGTKYIRTAGFDVPVSEIEVGISYEDFAVSSHALRYAGVTPEDIQAALKTFQDEAAKMLCDVPCEPDGLTQIDLVTGAGELWAFPFEAYAFAKPGVVLTRRIRGNITAHAAWPPVPKILFAHAATGTDLKQSLVDEHVAALSQGLRPWTGGDAKTLDKYLTVRRVDTLEALQAARAEAEYTHVHLLGHGILVPIKGPLKAWGVRLGPAASKGVHPGDIAKAFEPRNGLPVTVTIAACDSGNQADSATASFSLAQELHRLGVPVVVASQLPLTMHGSTLLTMQLYEPLLRGEDVREALAAARQTLRNDAKAYHDWLSVVAYVRLPENYTDHLSAVALQMELAMLNAAQKRADEVIQANDLGALGDVEVRVRERIASLEVRLKELKAGDDRLECQGLLASAHKRLAELLFLAKRPPAEQRLALEAALQHYSAAFSSDLNAHWQGMQQLALQAVLHGTIDEIDYGIVMRAAQNDSDFWALGTLAELHMLAPLAGKPDAMNKARDAAQQFRQRTADNLRATDSTRRQFRRYLAWWTPANGFKTDLSAHAEELAAILI